MRIVENALSTSAAFLSFSFSLFFALPPELRGLNLIFLCSRFFKKKKGVCLPRGMMMKSLHSNSQFCCKHVGFSYIFAKGIIARDTLPKAKE